MNFVERTLVLIKPDGVARGLVGEILGRFEKAGLAITALKIVRPRIEHTRKHYPTTDAQLEQMGSKSLSTYAELNLDPVEQLGTSDPKEIGLLIHEWNAEFLASGPIVACVIKGVHAVKKVRAICGKTIPLYAQPGTIRGDFSSSSPAIANTRKQPVVNLVHASDNENDAEEPETEIAHWFSEDEIIDYDLVDQQVMFPEKFS